MKVKSITVLFLILMSLFAFACETDSASKEEAVVELASETKSDFILRASFMSDEKSFVYTFDYDGNLLKLVDEQFEGASDFGPSFMVEGGAEITGSTVLNADPERPLNGDTVFENDCEVHYSVNETGGSESLVLRLAICDGDDVNNARNAFESLQEGLIVELL